MPFNAPPREPMGSQGTSSNRDSPPPRRFNGDQGRTAALPTLELHGKCTTAVSSSSATALIRRVLFDCTCPCVWVGPLQADDPATCGFHARRGFEKLGLRNPPAFISASLLAFQPHHTALCLCELPTSGCCILSSTGLDLRSF